MAVYFKGDMMDYLCTKQLSVGNRIIDSEHKKIFVMIDRIECLIKASDGSALSEAFKLLEDYLHEYFSVEEYIAQAINVPFTSHTLAHQCLLNEVQRIRNELAVNNGMWSDTVAKHYSKLLRDCLIKHIQEESLPMKIVLKTCFYDFKPS